MGTWNWVYFFGAGSGQLDVEAVVDSIIGADGFVRFDSGALAVKTLDDSNGERSYSRRLDFGDDRTESIRRLLRDREHFQTEYVGRDFPVRVTFAVGGKHPEVREHVAFGWLARAMGELDSGSVEEFRGQLLAIMQAGNASYAIGVSEPPDNIEDKLIEIDGVEVFDNTNWRGRAYDLLFVWVDESDGLAPPEGIRLGGRASLVNGFVEYAVDGIQHMTQG